MTWGFGHSPGLFDKCYATLVVAWGPLVKLFILKDIMNETENNFLEDGYYVLQSEIKAEISTIEKVETSQNQELELELDEYKKEEAKESERKRTQDEEEEEDKVDVSPFEIEDEFIECIYYLSDSTILVLTRA